MRGRYDVEIRPIRVGEEADARRLILEGLGEHFGFVDETINTDLTDIRALYGFRQLDRDEIDVHLAFNLSPT